MVRLNLQLFAKTVTDSIVNDVIRGKYGNGQARKTALTNAGYNYSEVQSAVNAALKGNSGGTSNTGNNNSGNANNSNNSVVEPVISIDGVDDALADRAYNSKFDENDYEDVLALKDEALTSKDILENLVNQKDIIDQSTLDATNQKFQVSDAYNQAMEFTNGLLAQLTSGRTSYTDRINEMMDKIQNRDEFEYDVDNDQLFQQALASAMKSGQTAMQDTIGQASSLTGGYGSTYATSAGNQAYNAFIEDAYNNLPEYYQMAMEAYQMEGQEMYNQLAMLNEADANEYMRMYNSWDANFKNAQNIWNQDFSTWEAGVNQAYNSANLQLNEYGQRVENAFNLYQANWNAYESMYAKEYASWQDMVTQAQQAATLLNDNYWKDQTYQQTERQFNYSIGDTNNDGVLSEEEKASMGGNLDDIPKAVITQAGEFENNGELAEYLDAQENLGIISEPQADYLYSANAKMEQKALTDRTWTMTDDGGVDWFGGIDNNGKAKDQYGNEYTMKDLFNELKKTMSTKDARAYVTNLQKQLGITK